MKKLFFLFILLPSLAICQQDSKSQQVQIDELKYQVNQLAETERQRKIEVLEQRIEQATTTIQNQSSTIENFDNFYTCISILIGLLAIGIPLGTFLVAIRPARQAIATMQSQVRAQIEEQQTKNQSNLDQLGMEIGKQLSELSNQYNEQLAEMNSNFADSNKALDEKYRKKTELLQEDYEYHINRIEGTQHIYRGHIAHDEEDYINAATWYFMGVAVKAKFSYKNPEIYLEQLNAAISCLKVSNLQRDYHIMSNTIQLTFQCTPSEVIVDIEEYTHSDKIVEALKELKDIVYPLDQKLT